jgi:hypothetical protein
VNPDAELLERLLRDAAFRDRFRHDPAAAAREAGFPDLAERLATNGTRALEPLELRESRSSVGGVMLAAAVEGLGLFELVDRFGEEAQAAGPPGTKALVAADAEGTPPDDEAAAPDDEAPAADGAAASDETGSGEPEPDDEPDEEEPDEDEPDEDEPDEDDEDKPESGEPNEPDEPGEPDEPEGTSEPDESDGEDGGDGSDGESGDDDDSGGDNADDETAGGSPDAPLVPDDDWRPSPDQYGVAGGGGPRSPIDTAVLDNARITLDADGRRDFAAGRMDPRIGEVLLRIAERHRITLSATSSDHPQGTAGGSPSNHWYGRAVDIATVDGEIVRPDSAAGRRLAAELERLDASIRPSEVGTPWALDAPGYFSDADHQDHIHVAFDDPVSPGWTPRSETRVLRALTPDER